MYERMRKCAAAIVAAALLLAGLGGCGSTSAQDWQSKYQTAAAELKQAQGKIEGLEQDIEALRAEAAEQKEQTVSPEEIAAYSARIAELEAKNAEQAAELQERQNQIDALWARVDAAQKNLDDAYAKLEQRSNADARAVSGASGSNTGSSAGSTQTVYITKTGSKYHNAGCQYLSKSKIAISLSKAKAQGYSACSRCF